MKLYVVGTADDAFGVGTTVFDPASDNSIGGGTYDLESCIVGTDFGNGKVDIEESDIRMSLQQVRTYSSE